VLILPFNEIKEGNDYRLGLRLLRVDIGEVYTSEETLEMAELSIVVICRAHLYKIISNALKRLFCREFHIRALRDDFFRLTNSTRYVGLFIDNVSNARAIDVSL
jgi:hypothetical protein